MPAFTAKLGLQMDDDLENYSVDVVNANLMKIDTNVGLVICTSVTRPSLPYSGQGIYETDTGRVLVYSTGQWRFVAAANMTVANQAARDALAPIWAGFTVWRIDKSWSETYDGAAWRVPNGVTTGNLADITNPVTGQVAILSTDRLEYRWTGAAWQSTRLVSPAPSIIRRLAATPAFTNVNFKIPFDTIVGTAVEVTHNAGDFTFARSGNYRFTASIRYSTSAVVYLWFAKSTNSAGNRGKTSSGPGVNLATSAEVPVTAGEVWSVWAWSSVANAFARESANAEDMASYFSAYYSSPL